MEPFIRRMKHFVELADEDFDVLLGLDNEVREAKAGETIVSLAETVDELLVIESGWALRTRYLEDGRRQVINLMMAGDYFDLMALIGATSDHSVVAATDLSLRAFRGKDFLHAIQRSSRIATAFWWVTVREESVLRQQIVRIGRMSAQERIANFVVELSRRQDISTGTRDDFVTLPVPQAVLADALGLSIVHVSRSLTAMKRRGLIQTNRRGVTIVEREGLKELAGFEPNHPAPGQLPLAAQ